MTAVHYSQVREQAVQSGIVPVLARLLNEEGSTVDIITMSASIIAHVSDVRQFPEEAQRHAVYAALITATSTVMRARRGGSSADPEMSLEALTEVLIRSSVILWPVVRLFQLRVKFARVRVHLLLLYIHVSHTIH
jgi:hypothetical protein